MDFSNIPRSEYDAIYLAVKSCDTNALVQISIKYNVVECSGCVIERLVELYRNFLRAVNYEIIR
jgi:hypothetical protein